MKRFHSDFRAKDILGPFFLVLILSICGFGLFFFGVARVSADPENLEQVGIFGWGMAAYTVALLAIIFLEIYVMVKVISTTSLDHDHLQFSGSVWGLFGRLIGWTLLSMITLGIYFPWMYRNMLRYIGEKTLYKENGFEFLSRPGRMLAYFFGALILPMVLITLLFANPSAGEVGPVMGLLVNLLTILIIIPFYALVISWVINFSWKTKTIRLNVGFWDAVGQLFVQIFLSCITLGIYAPAAYVKLYRFFLSKTEVKVESGELESRFGFDGEVKKGFGLIWGQALLCIITLGIYSPWAMEKIYRWWIDHTIVEAESAVLDA